MNTVYLVELMGLVDFAELEDLADMKIRWALSTRCLVNLMDIVELVDLADLADLVKLMVFADVVVLMDQMFVGRPGISGVSGGQALFWVLLYRRFCECVAVDIVIAGGGGLSIFFTIYKAFSSQSIFHNLQGIQILECFFVFYR